MDLAKEFLISTLTSSFQAVFGIILVANDLITKTPEEFNPAAFRMVKLIAEAIIPIALVMAVIFFMIELLKKTTMMEIVTIENVMKLVMKLVLCKVFVQGSFGLCVMIYNGFFAILNTVLEVTTAETVDLQQSLDSSLKILEESINGVNIWGLIVVLPFLVFFSLILMAVNWAIYLIIYGRFIELFMLFALCPIPISTITSDDVHDIAKKFLQKFIAVSMQAIIMIITLALFSAIVFGMNIDTVGDLMAIMGNYILMLLILVLTLFKSGQWAKDVVGLM